MLNPKIDKRDKQAIEREIKALASIYLPQWSPDIGDSGWAVTNAFSKMSEDVISHLNELPHKLFMDYLNRLEFRLNPPLSAKAPIMFTLAKGVKSSKIVPKYTQVADKNETIFEIEKSFSLTPARLIMCYSVNPMSDAIFNHSTELKDTKPFSLFKGKPQQEHTLFIGDSHLLDFNKAPSDFTFVQLKVPYIDAQKYKWQYFGGQNEWLDFESETHNSEIVLSKKNSSPSEKKDINGNNCYWIKVTLKTPLPVKQEPLHITYKGASGVDALYYNDIPINRDYVLTEKDEDKKIENIFFYPFGEEPKQNDIFYIASNEAFSKKGLSITISMTVKHHHNPKKKANISWEYWNGKSWKSLKATFLHSKGNNNYFPRQIRFVSPREIQKIEVNGEEGYWIRAKLVTNNYVVYDSNFKPTYNPPKIGRVVIYIDSSSSMSYQNLLAYNNLEYKEIDHDYKGDVFIPLEEERNSFYLNFDKPFGEGLISLFFEIKNHNIENRRYLQFYYSSLDVWKKLALKDSTNGLTHRGMCEFIAPPDQAKRRKFDQLGYWLKVEIVDIDSTTSIIEIEGIYLNTAWANQYENIDRELLGSSSGRTHQKFQLSKIPAKALTLWVNEPLQSKDESDNWVVWSPIEHLYNASSSAKVYTVDFVSGEICFGDNIHGLIPPMGRENIRVSYSFGGGDRGNVLKGEIKELVTTIASVDTIKNVSDASGGSEQQSIKNLLENAPKRLKTRNRAITLEDYEIIAKEASSDVARVRAFNHQKKSLIKVLIVPFSNDKKPQCSQELITNVTNYIEARSSITTTIKVLNPTYVTIDVTVTLIIDEWSLLSSIKERAYADMVTFLHPIYGGNYQKGWQFGEVPCYSDFFSLFESIDGVKYIEELEVTLSIGEKKSRLTAYDTTELSLGETILTSSGTTIITMKGEENGTENS